MYLSLYFNYIVSSFFFKQVLLITFFLNVRKKNYKKEEKYKIKSLMNYQEMKITPFFIHPTQCSFHYRHTWQCIEMFLSITDSIVNPSFYTTMKLFSQRYQGNWKQKHHLFMYIVFWSDIDIQMPLTLEFLGHAMSLTHFRKVPAAAVRVLH